MMYQLNFFNLFEHKLLAIFGSPIFIPGILVFLSVFKRSQKKLGAVGEDVEKFSTIGKGAQRN